MSLVPGFIGVGAIAWKMMTTAKAGASTISILLLILSAIAWAFGTVIATRRKAKGDSFSFAGMELLFGALALGVVSLARSEPIQFSLASVSTASWAALVFLSIAGTFVAFGAYIWLLQTVSASLVATYIFVNPIVAVFLGWLLLHEQLNWTSFAGLGLVTVSVLWLSLQQRRLATPMPHTKG